MIQVIGFCLALRSPNQTHVEAFLLFVRTAKVCLLLVVARMCRSAMGISGWCMVLSDLIQRPEQRELMRTESNLPQIRRTL